MTHEQQVRELYGGCYRRLVAQLFAFCGDLQEAEDAVQEAFVRAVAKPRQFARVDNPEAWLRTVAVNVVRRRYRRARMLSRIVSSGAAPVVVPDLSADHVAIVAALRRLPPEQREAIALHHVADLGVRQIAELVGVPEGTVKARLARGRAKLAPLVDDLADEPTGPDERAESAEPAREADHA